VTPLLGIYLKEKKSGYDRDTCTLIFNTALFIIAKIWKQHRCPKLMNGSRKCGIHAQWSFTQPQGLIACGLKVNVYNLRTSNK
jgi:hypothetical protein